VVSAEPIWKMKIEFERPSPLRINVPVSCAYELK
jgi:hypothetical protein